jgi:hypothetical protein
MNNTIAGPADRLRSALKHAGFTARQVTVKARSETLHVTLRDPSVSLTRVTEIAGAFECVRRDHATGEALAGRNGSDVFSLRSFLSVHLVHHHCTKVGSMPMDLGGLAWGELFQNGLDSRSIRECHSQNERMLWKWECW